jgi:hypothetical protein
MTKINITHTNLSLALCVCVCRSRSQRLDRQCVAEMCWVRSSWRMCAHEKLGGGVLEAGTAQAWMLPITPSKMKSLRTVSIAVTGVVILRRALHVFAWLRDSSSDCSLYEQDSSTPDAVVPVLPANVVLQLQKGCWRRKKWGHLPHSRSLNLQLRRCRCLLASRRHASHAEAWALTFLRPEVHTTINVKFTVFWGLTPCSLVDRHRCSRGIYHVIRRHFPEDRGLQAHVTAPTRQGNWTLCAAVFTYFYVFLTDHNISIHSQHWGVF